MADAHNTVDLTLRLNDAASAALNTAADRALRAQERVNGAAARAAAQAEATAAKQRGVAERLAAARETLGVRAENRIRREIQQTEAAYNRLARSGTLSAEAQARAYDAMRAKITALTNEMGKLTREQREQEKIARGMGVLKGAVAVGAGTLAAGAVLKPAVSRSMNFDEELGLLANTAYAGKPRLEKREGEQAMRMAIKAAIANGMTRDEALATLNKLVADDMVGGISGAMNALPFIAQVRTGSGSAGVDVAGMLGGFISSGFAKNTDEAKSLVGMASAAATAGAFEKQDMAKHLPSLLPAAKAAGLTGRAGVEKLLVMLQQARSTAGSSDQAAVNVANFLAKVQSNDTAMDFKKAGRGDLAKYLMQQRAKGIDPVTAWQNVIDSEIKKNPNLAPAISKITNAKSEEERAAAIEALTGMAEGQSIGKYFQDMQAKGALFGIRNKTIEKNVRDALPLQDKIVSQDYTDMADRPGVKARIARERAEMAQIDSMDKVTPAVSRVMSAFGDLADKYPLLAGTTILATTSIAALGSVAGTVALAMGAKFPGKVAGTVGGMAEKLGPVAGIAKNIGMVGAAGAAGYGVGSLVSDATVALTGQTAGGWIYDLLHKATPDTETVSREQIEAQRQQLEVQRQTLNVLHRIDGKGGFNPVTQATSPFPPMMNLGNMHNGAPG